MTINLICRGATEEKVKLVLELDAEMCRTLSDAFALLGAEFSRGSRRCREKKRWRTEALPRLKREHAERNERIKKRLANFDHLSTRKTAVILKHEFEVSYGDMEYLIKTCRREMKDAAQLSRDRKIFGWKKEGLRNGEIAKMLGLALGTVCNAVCRLKKEPPPPVMPEPKEAELYDLAAEKAERAGKSPA